ncbi:unnamed protein product [Laminaria digitata]
MMGRGVTLRGIVPLVLCASAAARIPLAGRSAFANYGLRCFCRDASASSTLARGRQQLHSRRTTLLRSPVPARSTASPRAEGQTPKGGVARFLSSSDGDGASSSPGDDLDQRVKAAIAALPRRPHCAVVGAGFAGLATAYHLAAFGSDVTVFDPNEVGTGGASSVAAGLLHPLTPRGKLIWKGEEGFVAAKELIEVINARLVSEAGEEGGEGTSAPHAPRGCITTEKVYRPLMDEKQFDMFTKAAEDLPQWLQRLTREEYLEAVPGSDAECLGGVCIRGALAVDAPTYLGGVWAACRRAANAGVSSGEDGVSTEGGATWVRESVENIHALEASGEFNAVVACVGAGVRKLAGVKDIASLRLYVVPSSVGGGASGNGGKLLCGSTQEPVLAGEKVDKPADMRKAMRQLRPKAARFFPAIEGVEPVGVTSGVRVIQDRNSYGRIPVAGRLPFSENGWVIAALGARGLIHHAYLGRLVAACALLNSDEHLPPQAMAPLEDLGKEATGDL